MAFEEKLRIKGGTKLHGQVKVSGAKNAALAVVPAALLAGDVCVLENLPDIGDVHVLIDMFKHLGVTVEFDGHTMRIDPRTITKHNAPYELASKMRASYYLVPVLLGIFGRAEVAMPGGCDIGNRAIDQTLKGWWALGAQVNTEGGRFNATLDLNEARACDLHLDMPSVGATVNTMLLAVTIEGNSTIHNVAKEPHVVDLANFLNSMGASVKGAGTDTIRIRGGRRLHGSTYTIVPDQIETGTLMIAAAAAGGDVTITDAIPFHMEALSAKLLEMGVQVDEDDDRIRVRSSGVLRAIDVKTQYYPGFPTDLQQPMTAALTVARGQSVVTENIYEARFKFVGELVRMGANVRVIEQVAIVEGVKRLTGGQVQATDLRAGAALIIAGLIAQGTTIISGVKYIQRGYDKIEEKLKQLGAQIELERSE